MQPGVGTCFPIGRTVRATVAPMPTSRRHLLLLDAHREIRAAFAAYFRDLHDHALHLVADSREARGLVARQAIDLAVVDLAPEPALTTRLDLIREWRGEGLDLPVLVTSAQDYDALTLQVFEAGADDFLRKPYLFPELHARIRRHLARRTGDVRRPLRVDGVTLPEEPFSFAGATVHPDLRITFPNGHTCRLGPKHVGILREFARHTGTLLLKEQLVQSVWGADANLNSGSVHQYVHLLRKLYREGGVDLRTFVAPESKAGWRIVRAPVPVNA